MFLQPRQNRKPRRYCSGQKTHRHNHRFARSFERSKAMQYYKDDCAEQYIRKVEWPLGQSSWPTIIRHAAQLEDGAFQEQG
jgi:hypothetical protein